MKEGVKREHVPDLRVRRRVALVDPPAEGKGERNLTSASTTNRLPATRTLLVKI